MSPVSRFAREERGGVLAIVAILSVLFLGLTAFSVDFGVLFLERRELVNASDAAALAAAEAYLLAEAECGVTDGAAQAKADELAQANTPEAARTLYETDCAEGRVSVRYGADQDLFFGQAIGFGSMHVETGATAYWGWAGGGIGVAPFMLSIQQTDCDIPYGLDEGDLCTFWFNNNDIGNAQWAQVNLNPNAWNVGADDSCPSAGATDTLRWINGKAPALTVNYPEPTYVCRDTGFSTTVITKGYNQGCPAGQDNGLLCQTGESLTFPVNDAYGDFPPGPSGTPHGQVDANGVLAPPPASPHKYDIVGFAKLLLSSVQRGNQGGEITCNKPQDANAWCLVLEWQGFQTGGIDPGGGGNFGLGGVGLGG